MLASLLKEARKRRGLTQEQVAAKLNKPRSFPHKVENAERELNVIELMDYCEALGEDFLNFVVSFSVSVREFRLQNSSNSV